jgi:hypothetical protein
VNVQEDYTNPKYIPTIINMGLNDFIEFIKRVTHMIVILLTIPYRHDLKCPNITHNNEIINFNGKLLKLKKLCPSYCDRNK